MFEKLQDRLADTFKTLKGKGKLREGNIEEALSEVRKSLLEADVQYKVAQSLVDSVKREVMGEKVLRSVDPGQQFIKCVHDELMRVLGDATPELPRPATGHPVKILVMGLQGTGKTTSSGKLAFYYREEMSAMPLLVPADTSRPAAKEQLLQLAKQNGLHAYDHAESSAVAATQNAMKAISEREVPGNCVIVDTAGRLSIDSELMNELREIKKKVQPDLSLYVLDSMVGQSALDTAKQFSEEVGFDGVIVSKLDGDSRGGSVLSVRQALDVPIYFLGVGEKVDDFERLHPDRMASRILGMGDVVSLVEKAQKVVDQDEAQAMAKKMRKNQFTIEDFANQMKSVQKMGGLESIVGMLPGGAQMKKAMAMGMPEKEMASIEAIINSMTLQERRQYQVIDGSRRKRIAAGSGTTVADVNRFLKQFIQAKKMMAKMNKMGAKGFARSGMFGR